jgi:PAS domain S-box-containing protein
MPEPPGNEAWFREFVEQLPAIVYLRESSDDPVWPSHIVYVGPQVERMLGVEPREWTDDPAAWWERLHPDDRAAVRSELQRAARVGERTLLEYRMRGANGATIWFRDEASPMRGPEGVLAWQGIMLDVTAQKEAEAAFLEAESRYRAIIEQSPMVSYLDAVDDSGTIYISPQAADVLGYSPGEFYADPGLWTRIVHPDDLVLLDDDPLDAEYRIVAKDGHIVWVHDLARLIVDETGKPRYWQGVLIDLTARREAEALRRDLERERAEAERLRVEDQMKTTFLQTVSHDLRTPLAAILGLAVTLDRHEANLGEGEIHDLTQRIAANARRLDRIVADFLDLERLQRGAAVPESTSVDVGRLVREWVSGTDLLSDRRLSLETAPVTIRADPAMVERIVENLIGNAVKHTPVDTQIWVRVEPADDGALLTVEDDGPGVRADERELIFEPFRQGARSAAGSGVGLALVARFAALHGGRAWVTERPGGGSSFRVTLAGVPPEGDDPREEHPDPDQRAASSGSPSAAESQA